MQNALQREIKKRKNVLCRLCHSDSQGDEKQSLRIDYHEHKKIRNKGEIAAELILIPRLGLGAREEGKREGKRMERK